jgi:hypothetical protein
MQSRLRQTLFEIRCRLSEIWGGFSLLPPQFDLEERKRNFYSSQSVQSHLEGLREGREVGPDDISLSLRLAARQLSFQVQNKQADLDRPVVCCVALGEAYRKRVRKCLQSHRDYAAFHSYAQIDMSEPPNLMFRSAPWYKIPLLYALLQKGHQNIFQLDADAIVTNGTIKLESYFEELRSAGKSWLLSQDDFGLNTGVLFIRNTPGTLRLLDLIWSYDLNLNHHHWEQHALVELVKNCSLLQKQILIPDEAASFNRYPREFVSPRLNRRLNTWNDGDFICHFAGLRRRDLEEIADAYSAKARPPG